MGRANRGAAGQIGDRAGKFEHPVVSACRELELAHGSLHQPLTGFIQAAVTPHVGRVHIGITERPATMQPLRLPRTRCTDSFADGARLLALAQAGELFVINPWYLDMYVDPIEERPADPPLVAADRRRAATTLPFGIAMPAA